MIELTRAKKETILELRRIEKSLIDLPRTDDVKGGVGYAISYIMMARENAGDLCPKCERGLDNSGKCLWSDCDERHAFLNPEQDEEDADKIEF